METRSHTLQLASILKRSPRRVTKRILAILLFLLIAGAAWHHHQSQPLTPEQRIALSALVNDAARQSGESRRKVWELVKIHLNIRRIQEIERMDFDKARDLLLQKIQTASR